MKADSRQIAEATGGVVAEPGPQGPIETDSRTLARGAWFLALVGDRFDGHGFVDQVAQKGACGVIVSKDVAFPGGVVRVPDTTRALQDLGRWARAQLACPVVALTGSSGKTTTRALISLAVGQLGRVHQTTGNLNNHLGVPMTLLASPEEADVVVVEMGTSGPGEIALLCDIARPTARLVVNVGPAHLLELGGLDGVAREKGQLFATARPGDLLCVNLDDPYVRAMPRPEGTRIVTWGIDPAAQIRLVDVSVTGLSTAARYATPLGDVAVTLPVPGTHVAHDAAGALAIAFGLGLDVAAAAKRLEGYAPVGMRMRTEPLPGGAVALNDAYNANPQSMEASLRTLAGMPGRRAAVLGDMLELGTDEAAWHEHVARIAGSLGLDLVVLAGKRMSAAAKACEGAGDVWAFEDAAEVAPRLGPWLRPGDHVLVKGSRGSRMERVLQALTGGSGEAH